MLRFAIVLTLLAGASRARAEVPKACSASIELIGNQDKAQFAAAVTAIKPHKDVPGWLVIELGTDRFQVYIPSALLPFKVGDKLDVTIRRGGGWHRVYDGIVKDGTGKVLLVASGSGADDMADGWKATVGAVATSRQDPNQREKSVERTHAVELTRGKVSVKAPPDKCVEVRDGAVRWLVHAYAVTWEGLRPPEGVDYRSFSLIRR